MQKKQREKIRKKKLKFMIKMNKMPEKNIYEMNAMKMMEFISHAICATRAMNVTKRDVCTAIERLIAK